nr:PREDICTED: catalase-like [Bemisia tabaci]XP_018898000.1 PREDICTED: catalase-like [Bemisia tabaci]
MCRSLSMRGLIDFVVRLVVIHEAWVHGIILAAGQINNVYNVYKEDNGAPIPDYTVSRTVGKWGPILLEDMTLIQHIAHFDRERIPERVVHALGSGAFGFFEVTHDITRFCKAAVFKPGTKTPVAVRFSTVTHERGGPDVGRNPRGFAIKFYTSDGIWDLCGNNTPIFFLRDPMLFPAMVHSQRGRNPRTNRPDPNMPWDFITHRHEMLFQIMRVYSELGTPDGFRHMDGFGSHTFIMVNARNQPVYCKFHLLTDQGVRNLTAETAKKLAGENPNYSSEDLFEAIEGGDFPSWSMFIQVMTFAQADRFEYSVFDLTKVWPLDRYPLLPVGRMVLNRNPQNFYHEIEQLAFCPSNLVPGIQASRDPMLQARMFSYKDTQRYRLGPNFMQIPVNRPLETPYNLQRDGPMNMFNQGANVNYYPNSYSSLRTDPYSDAITYNITGVVGRHDTKDEDNYTQAREWYLSLSDYDKLALAKNVGADLKGCTSAIKKRVFSAFNLVHPTLAGNILLYTPPE